VSTTTIIERGDIFASTCQVLVNPVNCVGVSGKGLAKEFKRRFPLSVRTYEKDIRDASNGNSAMTSLWIGAPADYGVVEHGKTVLFFATKVHWRDASVLSHIDDGLDGLVLRCEHYRYPSIAIPALGCGLGQLVWGDVLPLIKDAAKVLNERGVTVEIYAPLEAR
jgi:O-acetyl-ADP-ribose deacetylase (regulator of RNase III)